MLLPLVSVGIPTYNRPEGLKETLNRLKQQTYSQIEIIISDNCSPDERVQTIGLEAAKHDSRIRFYRQKENIEAEPNFNFVFNQARGKYFMWMSDDDVFEANYIEVLVDFLEKNPSYVHAVGIAHYEKNGQILLSEKGDSIEQNSPQARLLQYIAQVRKNGLFYGLFRKDIPIREPFKNQVGTDWCLIAQFAWLGKIKRLETTSYQRSLDGGSATRSRLTSRWKMTGIKRLFFESYVAYKVCTGIFVDELACEGNFFLKAYIFIWFHFKFLWNSIRKRFDKSYV